MIARVTTWQTTSDKLDDVIKSFKERVFTAAKLQKGYRSSYMLTDRYTGKFISIGFWDSEEDANADEQSGQYQRRVSILKNASVIPPTHELFEVSLQA